MWDDTPYRTKFGTLLSPKYKRAPGVKIILKSIFLGKAMIICKEGMAKKKKYNT